MLDLKPLLKPVLSKFLESLETIYKQAESVLKQSQDERLRLENDREELRQEILRNAELIRKELFLVKGKQEKLDATYKDLSDKILEKESLNKEIRLKLEKIDTNVTETQELKNQASLELEKKRLAKEAYVKKSSILQEDFDKAGARTRGINDRDNKVAHREKIADKRDDEQAAESYVLSQRELKAKENERRIKSEWGRIDVARSK